MLNLHKTVILTSLMLTSSLSIYAMEKPGTGGSFGGRIEAKQAFAGRISNEEAVQQFLAKYKNRLQKMLSYAHEDLGQDFTKLLKLIAPLMQDENAKKEILNEFIPFLEQLKIIYKDSNGGFNETGNYITALIAYAVLTNNESDMQAAYEENEKNRGLVVMDYWINQLSNALGEKEPTEMSPVSENIEIERPMMENKVIIPIEEYTGDKLLLCAGHPDFEKIQKTGNYYNQTNEQWYTVDYETLMSPDFQADLNNPNTYEYLGKKTFGIVFAENCPHLVDHEVRKNTASLIKNSGILVSKFCGKFKDVEKVKMEMSQAGFSRVIFGEGGDYWMKYVSPENIISTFLRTERKEAYPRGINPCDKSDGSQGQVYSFVAIK